MSCHSVCKRAIWAARGLWRMMWDGVTTLAHHGDCRKAGAATRGTSQSSSAKSSSDLA
ncbi:hypothetical protein AB7B51_17490 [Acinetobacter baumannii]|uniref:hypothetical protein n=1 Tax=Acinetobacter baumannii TaxID=470 RepID=UPI0034E2F9F9